MDRPGSGRVSFKFIDTSGILMTEAAKRILIVAGEVSSDRYGARLVAKLKAMYGSDELSFYGTGGDEMQKAGVHLICHVRELAHIGVREALSSLRVYYRTYRRLIKESARQAPHLAVLLDFPDFNLPLAKKMKRRGVRVIYYISPQVWAWRSGRVRTIRDYVDKLLVILPFEEEYYRLRGVPVEFVGHPILEDFSPNYDREAFLKRMNLDPARKTIALLAGSRRKEIEHILPALVQASQCVLKRTPAQFLISQAPTIEEGHIKKIMSEVLQGDPDSKYFRISTADSRDILANADFAFVKSGTSSLEAALVGTPFLITYKVSSLSWWIGSALIHSSTKGLANLVAQETIVPELLQKKANPEALAGVALEYLENPEKSAAMRSKLAKIRERLSARCASERAAAAISSYLNKDGK
jgi:lipid-A-disaccharide synthase